MNIENIIANVYDIVGGETVRKELNTHTAVLHVMNVIDAMMQEVTVLSPKDIRGFSTTQVLTKGVQTGRWDISDGAFDPSFIRYRFHNREDWKILPIVDDLEDVTRAENEVRYVVMLTNENPLEFFYHLSFEPTQDISIEVWSRKEFDDIADLSALPPFPRESGLYCAYRAADFVLNELLLHDARRFGPYVQAQKMSVEKEKIRLQVVWDSWLRRPSDHRSVSEVRPYNSYADYTSEDDTNRSALIPPITQ